MTENQETIINMVGSTNNGHMLSDSENIKEVFGIDLIFDRSDVQEPIEKTKVVYLEHTF